MLESMLPVPRCLLLLDIDENLISVKIGKSDKSALSASAELFLNDGAELTNVELRPDERAFSVKAICRQEWIDVFNEIIAVNKLYHELNPEDSNLLITVGFLTSSTYTYTEFSRVFGQLFAENILNNLFMPGESELPFFSHDDMVEVCQPEKNNKGTFMDACFPDWDYDLGGLERENTWLVDDNRRNCENAKQYGFSSIHNPTNIHGRSTATLYRDHKPRVFNELHELVNKSKTYCDALMKSRQATSCNLL